MRDLVRVAGKLEHPKERRSDLCSWSIERVDLRLDSNSLPLCFPILIGSYSKSTQYTQSHIFDVLIRIRNAFTGPLGQYLTTILHYQNSMLKLGIRIVLTYGCKVVAPNLQTTRIMQSYYRLYREHLAHLHRLTVLGVNSVGRKVHLWKTIGGICSK